MKGNQKQIDLNGLIEKYRWWIGGFLLLAIILSGGYLLWREGRGNDEAVVTNDEHISQLESRIKNTELKIEQLESKTSNTSNGEAATQSNNITSGQVAGASSSSPQTSSKTVVPSGRVNLNSASATELDTLPGIGAAYAQRIIEYRQSHGGFKDISELKNIKGIGDKTYEKLKDLVTI